MDIRYDLGTANTSGLFVSVGVSTNGGLSYTLPATNFTGDVGSGITAGANKLIVWDAARDWPEKFSTNVFFRLTASDIVLIPAGNFTMGDNLDGDTGSQPVHTVYVSAFYIDKYEVTKALWDGVYQWAITNGYSFDSGAQGKATNHPAHSLTWYDAVKWCNARSEKESRTPAYYTDAALSVRYRTGQVAPYVNWSSGYRLPTEAEWEKAARGGLSGHRFPWGDTISESRANYYGNTGSYSYDLGPNGYNATFATGGEPYTSPVGYFAANGYGLYDMAGNVWEWCWDWYGGYSSGSQTDPRGPTSGSARVFRGGSWFYYGSGCRSAFRSYCDPSGRYYNIGFRVVLAPGQ